LNWADNFLAQLTSGV